MPADEIVIEAVDEPTDEHVRALAQLLPHLSSAPVPDFRRLHEIVSSGATRLLFAKVDGSLVGTLSLVIFTLPTGRRAWIEDVVVNPDFRGRGVASALVSEAVRLASAARCRTVDLTSRPDRVQANRLYERLGFERRITNVYRKSISG
ncbi:MAG TPA: GNAT family N-acetyltransferase [Acidimicrobiales bacterium]|nr:GNAT family N-acetyltransferase [Acidimicrobiales bacterium]